MMIRSLQRTDTGTENFRNLFIFEFIIIAHVEDQSLLFRKGCDCFLQGFLQVIAIEVWITFNFFNDIILATLAGGEITALPLLIKKIYRC